MSTKNTFKSFKKAADTFCNLHTLDDMAVLLKVDKKELILKSFEPLYYHFTVPKADGSGRHVEAPEASLKAIQRRLNEYLQKVYYLHQSEAAYGYIPVVIGGAHKKKYIYKCSETFGM